MICKAYTVVMNHESDFGKPHHLMRSRSIWIRVCATNASRAFSINIYNYVDNFNKYNNYVFLANMRLMR